MGAKQSKRSVDITTTPKKGEGEIIGEGEGKVEKIAELDVKAATTNGAVHPEIEFADKDDNIKDQSDIKENGVSESEDGVKTAEDGDVMPQPTAAGDKINESITTEKTTPTENNDENKDKSVTVEETTENKKNKEKSKKKKWSLRSISFSKKDKSKPSKDSEKNGDVKEVNEENAAETSPSVETPKTEEAKVAMSGDNANATPIEATNGNATAEELAKVDDKSIEATATTTEEQPAVKEEPAKVPEPAESAPSPIKEEPSKVVEEPTPKVEESKPVVEITNTTTPDNVVEESKEVRTEDVPPPLPSSNPPSPVTVFAESTKADNNLNEIIPSVEALNVANTVDEIPKVVENIDETPNTESITHEEQILKTEIELVENIASTEATIGSINSESCLPSPPQDSVELSESISDIHLPDIVNDNIVKESESLLDIQSETIVISPSTETISNNEIAIEANPIKESNENNEVDKPELLVEESVESCKLEEHKTQDLPPPPPNSVDDKSIEQEQLTEKDPIPQSTLDIDVPKEEIPSNLLESINGNATQDLPSTATESVPSEDPVQDTDNCPITKAVIDLPNESSSSLIEYASCVNILPAVEKNPESNKNISSPVENVLPADHCPALSKNLEPIENIPTASPTQDALPTLSDNPVSHENTWSPIQDIPPTETLPASVENPETNLTNNADSLPDISTESLPSLPEPVSESLPEPMSLPPVESLPEPIVSESPAIIPDPSSNCSPIVDTLPLTSPSPVPTNETVLTNGNMNGLSSPIVTNDEIVPPVEGPLKQVATAVPDSQYETTVSVESTEDSTTATTEE